MTSPDQNAIPRLSPSILPRIRISTRIVVGITARPSSQAIRGETQNIDIGGIGCVLSEPLPLKASAVKVDLTIGDRVLRQAGELAWIDSSTNRCGIRFKAASGAWIKFVTSMAESNTDAAPRDRRFDDRRKAQLPVQWERRIAQRRFSSLLEELEREKIREKEPAPTTKRTRSRCVSYTRESVTENRKWIEDITGTPLNAIGGYIDDPSSFKGKIERPIGAVQIPVGIVGPILVNGVHAKGQFFIPMATTEGALVTSYNLGSQIVTRSGGANVRIIKDELKIGPMFVFRTLPEAHAFTNWMKANFATIKRTAEGTSSHLILRECTFILDGRKVNVNFHYETADAMGMNMACAATEAACRLIANAVRPEEYWLRSNFNSNKKATANGLISGYGKTVTADVTIPRNLVSLLDTTPERMQRYVYRTLLSDAHAVMVGANGHFANAITAIYLACGQDVALVANSHLGISTCEVTESGDLYFSAYLSSILVGTVGGGTSLATTSEALKILGCYGEGKAQKLAEIIAAAALAGEVSICAAIVNGTYVLAHQSLGRNPPKRQMKQIG